MVLGLDNIDDLAVELFFVVEEALRVVVLVIGGLESYDGVFYSEYALQPRGHPLVQITLRLNLYLLCI